MAVKINEAYKKAKKGSMEFVFNSNYEPVCPHCGEKNEYSDPEEILGCQWDAVNDIECSLCGLWFSFEVERVVYYSYTTIPEKEEQA